MEDIMPCKSNFQSNIQENKDWNIEVYGYSRVYERLSEQHPREQGLKPWRIPQRRALWLSFQSNIQENKDWNWLAVIIYNWDITLSEQHPREQGLKRHNADFDIHYLGLSEQHPREQGLKLYYYC